MANRTGDTTWLELETAALDWLFGANPWGVSMVIGLPHDGVFARDPHSVVAKEMGIENFGTRIQPLMRSRSGRPATATLLRVRTSAIGAW